MKREDQIIKAAMPFLAEPLRYLGFMDGVTWADEHPQKYLIDVNEVIKWLHTNVYESQVEFNLVEKFKKDFGL